jgi:hypothetical protein
MQGPLSASANSTPVYRPNLSGGADRVFRVPLPLFYNFFCNSYSTVLAILLSAWAFPKILHANPHGIQSFYVVKDVGASYDGLVDSFELNSNNYTSPPPPCWYSALVGYVQTHNVNHYCLYRCCHQRDITLQGDKLLSTFF